MKILIAILMFSFSLQATAITGTMKNPDGTNANGILKFALAQQAALVALSGCGGPLQIVPTYQVQITISGGLVTGSPTIYGNDCMLPQGLYYNIQFVDTNGNVLFTDRWVITGTSVDIGTIQSVVISGTTGSLGGPGVLFTTPSGAQTVTQPSTSVLGVNNFTVSAIFAAPNGATCTVSGCTGFTAGNAVTLTGAQTITGAKTFTSSLLASGSIDLGTATNPFNIVRATGAVETVTMEVLSPGSTFSSPVTWQWFSPSTTSVEWDDTSGNPISVYDNSSATPKWTITGNVIPATNTTYLGTAAAPWQNVTAVNVVFSGTITSGSSVGVTSTTCTVFTNGICTHN